MALLNKKRFIRAELFFKKIPQWLPAIKQMITRLYIDAIKSKSYIDVSFKGNILNIASIIKGKLPSKVRAKE